MIVGASSGGFMLIYIVALFALLYFLMIRPQKKHQDKHKQMLNALKVNDRILTVGGITGYVRDLNDSYIYVEIADGLVIELNRQYVAAVLQEEDEQEAIPEDAETVEQVEEASDEPVVADDEPKSEENK